MPETPGPNVPFPPMEAELVSELPAADGWRYEPKWDGFRGVLENDGGELALWSRNGRPLLRYCPELRPLGELMPRHSALDAEIVIARGGALDFDAMQMRLHPAESRVRKLAGEIPATFVAFDLLLWKGKPVHERPIEKRRAELEKIGEGFEPSPVSDDVEQGREWLQTLRAAGFDGVVAKRLGLPYLHGSRDGVVKVTPHRTADCVVAAARRQGRPAGRGLAPRAARDDFFAAEGWTRFGAPGIFGKFGGYGASPAPSPSSRSTHSNSFRRSQTASSMPACTSPSSAKRAGIVASVKSSVSSESSSAQRNGAETVASGRARTEYAEAIVRSRAFWL